MKIKALEMLNEANNNLRIHFEKNFNASNEEVDKERKKNVAAVWKIAKMEIRYDALEQELKNVLTKLEAKENSKTKNSPGEKRKPVSEPQTSVPDAKRSRNLTQN